MKRRFNNEIDPDQVLLDSSNLPNYDQSQFEGRLEKPISKKALLATGLGFLLCLIIFVSQVFNLQIVKGSEYSKRSENNILNPSPIFASRGAIVDRNGVSLAWNAPVLGTTSLDFIPRREYTDRPGLAHILGYVHYPTKDKNGFYFRDDFEGVDGVEKYYNSVLTGKNGSRLVETDARGHVVSHSTIRKPDPGQVLNLSIDSRIQNHLYESIKDIASEYAFQGGAGIIMDVNSGEVLAMTSYPEYDSQLMSDKNDSNRIRSLLQNKNLPFLDRAIDGLYTPGSIIKPYIAMGVLNENILRADDVIYTTGQISVQSPYDPEVTNIYRDWKNHGAVDLRKAIAVSSDVYFYIVGGGYKDQKGMGIANIDKYLGMFGMGEAVPESFFTGPKGVLSSPAWKQATFNESWFLGNTYHSVIGQYGTQVTLVQMVRAVAALANRGKLLIPTLLKEDGPYIQRTINLPEKYFEIVHEGMRMAVTQGTSVALNRPYVEIAAKSGTAELGVSKSNVNSWITGFWPYKNPKYAFVIALEHGSVHNLIGAVAVMKNHLDWMNENTPEYFKVAE